MVSFGGFAAGMRGFDLDGNDDGVLVAQANTVNAELVLGVGGDPPTAEDLSGDEDFGSEIGPSFRSFAALLAVAGHDGENFVSGHVGKDCKRRG